MAEIDLSALTRNQDNEDLVQIVGNIAHTFETLSNRLDHSVKVFGDRVLAFSSAATGLRHFAGNFGATSAKFLAAVSEFSSVITDKLSLNAANGGIGVQNVDLSGLGEAITKALDKGTDSKAIDTLSTTFKTSIDGLTVSVR